MRRVLDAAGLSGISLVSLDDVAPFDEAPETGATFEENALAKARDAFAATGLPSVADDSGLEVDALNGMPGVLSARWAGVHGDDGANNALLLAQLRDVPDERRGAAFVSASALVSGAGEVVVRGRLAGPDRTRVAWARRVWLRPVVRPGRVAVQRRAARSRGEGLSVAPRPGAGLAASGAAGACGLRRPSPASRASRARMAGDRLDAGLPV